MLSESSTRKIEFIIKVFYIAVVAAIIYLVYRFIGIIFPFALAFILVVILQPAIRLIHKKLRINKKLLSILLIIIVYVGVGALLFWLVTQLFFTLRDSLTTFPDYFRDNIEPLLSNANNSIADWISGAFPEYEDIFSSTQIDLASGLQNVVSTVSQKGISLLSSLIGGLPNFFIALLFTIISSFVISSQYDVILRFIQTHMPKKLATSMSGIRTIASKTILKYIKAMAIMTAITFVQVAIGLLILRIPNAVGIAIIIAFVDLLPVFGPGAIIIPWIIIELVQANWKLAIGLAIIYAVITIVRRVIEPKVVGDQLGLHPILSLLSIYVGYRLFGFLGMIIFPVIAQILLAMHKNGNFKSLKDQQVDKT